MDTVAVYWEPIIRTYGFEVREDLTMARLEQARPGRDDLALLPAVGDGESEGLVMAAAGRDSDAKLMLWVIVHGALARALQEQSQTGTGPELTYPVDVVHFHGPHFGDRYGIAAAVLSALQQGEVGLLLAGFTGASVFLAVPGGDGARAVESLQQAFTVPTVGDARRRQEPPT